MPYPGIRQSTDSCVFVSVAGAINWLIGSNWSEANVWARFLTSGLKDKHFDAALKCMPSLDGLEIVEYHDVDNKLADARGLIDKLRSGGVLVISLEVVGLDGAAFRKVGWHMLSIFRGAGDYGQVWDTNGMAGIIQWDEVFELLTADSVIVPSGLNTCFLPHDRHHCLYIRKV